jgi:hypothetical protein
VRRSDNDLLFGYAQPNQLPKTTLVSPVFAALMPGISLGYTTEASKAPHKPSLISVAALGVITKADVHLESTRNRKKTRRWRYTCRPNTGGQTPRGVVSAGYLRVALVGGLFWRYMS